MKIIFLKSKILPTLIFFTFSICAQSFGQQSKIDSLEKKIADLSGPQKVDAMIELSEIYNLKNLYSSKELEIINSAYDISKKINYSKGIARTALIIGTNVIKEDKNKKNKLFEEALSASFMCNDTKFVAETYKSIAGMEQYSDSKKSIIFYEKALNIYSEIGLYKEQVYIMRKISFIYSGGFDSLITDYNKSNQYLTSILEIEDKLNDSTHLIKLYALQTMAENYTKLHEPDKSLEFYNKALELALALKSKFITNLYKSIAKLYSEKSDFEKAVQYFDGAIKSAEQYNNKQIYSIYQARGDFYKKEKYYEKSINDYLKALELNTDTFSLMVNVFNSIIYSNLSENYDSLGNFKEAYHYFKQSVVTKDSAFNKEERAKIAELQGKYDTERKEKEIALLNKDKELQKLALQNKEIEGEEQKKSILLLNKDKKLKEAEIFNQKAESEKKSRELKMANQEKKLKEAENKKQQFLIWSFLGGLLITMIFAIVISRSLRITKKQKHIITLQKDEVTKQREEIAHKNKELTDSINYAQRIQSAILTSEQYLNDMFLPQGQVSSHFILYKPKDIVAGDFYWAYKTPDEKAIWVSADCTGHGVPGAFMSMIGNSLLNEIVMEKGIHEPDEILNNMRAGVIKALGQSGGDKKKDGMDAALCCWDKTKNKISFSGANNSLWIIRKGEFIEIEPDIQPIGHYLETNKPFTKKEFQLQQGDALFTFTDGYCDQFGGPKGKKFKYKPFRELLISIQDKSMSEQKEILNKTIDDWRGELEQIDDICVFGVRV